MTPSNLKTTTALLGFSETLSDLSDGAESAFYAALNRALAELDRLRPRTGTLFLTHAPAENLAEFPHFHLAAGTSRTEAFDAAGAYYFEATGTGECTVCVKDATVVHRFANEPTPRAFAGTVSGSVTLTFSAADDCEIRDFGVYEIETSAPVGGGRFVGYALGERLSDFALLAEPPARLQNGVYLPLSDGYYLEDGNRLYLDRALSGDYRIRYRKRAPTVTEETDDESELPLDRDLAELAPLLIAYYLLLDDDPDKALAYLVLYREQANAIRQSDPRTRAGGYYSTNNW